MSFLAHRSNSISRAVTLKSKRQRRAERKAREEEERRRRREQKALLAAAGITSSQTAVRGELAQLAADNLRMPDVAGRGASEGVAGVDPTFGAAGPRKRFRRCASTSTSSAANVVDDSSSSAGDVDPTLAGGQFEEHLSRRSRRRSAAGPPSSDAASDANAPYDSSNSSNPSPANVPPQPDPLARVEEITPLNVVTTIAAPVLDEHEGMDAAALREHEEVTKVKNVAVLELGRHQMDTWYFSPLPKELLRDGSGVVDVLYVDEFTLEFFTRKEELRRYQRRTLGEDGRGGRRHPPGNEIYRCGNLSSEFISLTVFGIEFVSSPCDAVRDFIPFYQLVTSLVQKSVRGGRPGGEAVLPEPVLHRQAVPRPQDAVFRRRPVPVLRALRG